MKTFLKVLAGTVLGTIAGEMLIRGVDMLYDRLAWETECFNDGGNGFEPDASSFDDYAGEWCVPEDASCSELDAFAAKIERRKAEEKAAWEAKTFCNGLLSRDMLCPWPDKRPSHSLDDVFIQLFNSPEMQAAMKSCLEFQLMPDGSVTNTNGSFAYIVHYPVDSNCYQVTNALYHFLVGQATWANLACGQFEKLLEKFIRDGGQA